MKLQQPPPERQHDKAAEFAARFERATGRKLPIDPAPASAAAQPSSPAQKAPGREPVAVTPRVSAAERRRRDRERKRATRERRARAEAERETKLYDRLKQRLADLGASIDHPPPMIPLWIWRMAWTVIGDATGKAARMFLRRLRQTNGAAVGAILRALFGDEAADELPAESSWSDLDTRRTCAAGLALVHLARPHRKRGPWGAQAMGIPQGAFCALLHNPFDQRPAMPARAVPGARAPTQRMRRPGTPHRNTLFGTHNEQRGEVGYMVQLARAGLFTSYQLPTHQAKACEIGPSGHPIARYDVITDSSERTTTPEQAAAVAGLVELADLAIQTWRPPSQARAAPT